MESTRECAAVTDMDFKNMIFRRLEIASADRCSEGLGGAGIGKKEKNDVVFICVVVRSVCGVDIDTGKSGHRGGELQLGDRYQDSGRGGHGVGHGLSDQRTGRDLGDQQEELDLSHLVGTGDGGVVAVLLSRAAGRGGLQSRSDRQAQCRHHAGARVCVFA